MTRRAVARERMRRTSLIVNLEPQSLQVTDVLHVEGPMSEMAIFANYERSRRITQRAREIQLMLSTLRLPQAMGILRQQRGRVNNRRV